MIVNQCCLRIAAILTRSSPSLKLVSYVPNSPQFLSGGDRGAHEETRCVDETGEKKKLLRREERKRTVYPQNLSLMRPEQTPRSGEGAHSHPVEIRTYGVL